MTSEHAKIRENLEVFLTGGLDAEERVSFEQHIAGCEACRELVEEAGTFDESMKGLFAGVGPEPGLEDRVVQTLRKAPAKRVRIGPWLTGVAAILLLGVLGFVSLIVAEKSPVRMADYAPKRGIMASPPRSEVATPEDLASHRVDKLSEGFGETRGFLVEGLPEQTKSNVVFSAEKARPAPPPAPSIRGPLGGAGYGDDYDGRLRETEESGDRVGGKLDNHKRQQGRQKNKEKGYYTYRDEGKSGKDGDYFKPGHLARGEDKKKREPKAPAKIVDKLERNREQPEEDAPDTEAPPEPDQPVERRIIRNGRVDFEVESFDSSLSRIIRIVGEEGGFVATTNSRKLPNGKVRGTVIARVPPDKLEKVVDRLRDALDELISRELSAQDVTKHYFDLASRIRAARTMEARLLKIIEEGKGEVKDLLAVEKELGVWREKIERFEGEIRYYNNLIAMSTLTITITEKDIRTAHTAVERETVNMSIEAVDVPKQYKAALEAIAAHKGRIVQADMRQYDAGQMGATIRCTVTPEKSLELTDRLRQLGRVSRFDSQRQQTLEGGGPAEAIKVERKDTAIHLSLYNLTNISPRLTAHMSVAVADVEGAYKAMLKAIRESGGRVITSALNESTGPQTTANVTFDIPAAAAGKLEIHVRGAGEILTATTTENRDTQNVTESKQGFQVHIADIGNVAPRETLTTQLASENVVDAHQTLRDKVAEWGGRTLDSRLNENDPSRITASLYFEMPRAKEKEMTAQLEALGDIISRTSQRQPESSSTTDSKIRVPLTIINLSQVAPRETLLLAIEVGDVDETFQAFRKLVEGVKGRVESSNLARQRNGQIVGKATCSVPLRELEAVVAKMKEAGTVRVAEASRNPGVPDSRLSIARINVTVANAALIIPSDEGFGSQFKTGLSWAFRVLTWSLLFILIGLAIVGPWALIGYGGFRIYKSVKKRRAQA